MTKKQIGQLGENLATKFLLAQKYQIITRNYRTKFGEIDIIAKKEKELIFIEVKTRSSTTFGPPEASINFYKKQHLLKSAITFIQSQKHLSTKWRVDLIGIKLNNKYKVQKIEHLKNILNG